MAGKQINVCRQCLLNTTKDIASSDIIKRSLSSGWYKIKDIYCI